MPVAGVMRMDQPTLDHQHADLEYQGKRRKARRELFLERIRPDYPKAGNGHRP